MRKKPVPDFRSWHWNGQSILPHAGGVPLNDRGFRYGQHLFESIAIRNNKALLLSEHLELLADASKRNGFPFTRTLSSALRRFVESVSLSDGMLRIYLTAGEGAPAAPIRTAGCYLTWEPVHFPTDAQLEKGIRLTVLTKPFLGDAWGEKSGNYAAHLKALADALTKGGDEGIVLDAKGRALSCAMGNLLVWMRAKQGIVLCTPPVSRGARSGSVLGWVKKSVPVMERDFRPADLRKALAMAVTNSRLGVMPIASLNGMSLRDPTLSRTLSHSYLEYHGLLRRS
ncbi:MAG: aminotransferase class IV [Verrucomicrobia bacterium]|nr:aminotransferase class IV [Verrucomicrobiota bacterium]